MSATSTTAAPPPFKFTVPDLPETIGPWRVASHKLLAGGGFEVVFVPNTDSADARFAAYNKAIGQLRGLETQFKAGPEAARFRAALEAERSLERELQKARTRAAELIHADGSAEEAIAEATRAALGVRVLEARKPRLAAETDAAASAMRAAAGEYLAGPYEAARAAAAEESQALRRELATAGPLTARLQLLDSILRTIDDDRWRTAILADLAPEIKKEAEARASAAAVEAQAQADRMKAHADELKVEAHDGRPHLDTPTQPKRHVGWLSRDTPDPRVRPRPATR